MSSMQAVAIEPLLSEPSIALVHSSGQIAFSDESTSSEVTEIYGFFVRNGIDTRMKEACYLLARSLYPNGEITPVKSQGYCSYTLAIYPNYLVQFRTEEYQLDIRICEEAKSIFGTLVPRVQYLGSVPLQRSADGGRGLYVYVQERIPGVTLEEFRKRCSDDHMHRVHRRRLVEDIAEVFAVSLQHEKRRHNRSGSDTFKKGLVGRSLRWRLDILTALPDKGLREQVDVVASSIDHVEGLPWCLTHGDLVPANIMVDPDTGHLTGLIDWAEGEWLPFGVGLYGLEEVLGYEDPAVGFRYYEDHKQLRELFWNSLKKRNPAMKSSSWIRHVELSRTLGILLWRGIAFEDGRIDRVVEPGRDDTELHKLKLFLAEKSQLEEG
ncbi:hypothetical protein BGZ63DRAFT_110484 [Mariannaea sp. PMI_226]|nr:hypothetical protein BGZ63DRAFT_110484 [Mariannaea sp. PMI_226]